MSINMILAVSNDLAIGDTNAPDGLPWSRNPDDMKFFKEMTTGNVVVYGGNTFRQFQKMGMENGLPERFNIVLTHSAKMSPTLLGGYFINQVRFICGRGFKQLKNPYIEGTSTWIIGGKSIYDQLHPYCDKVYLTRINQDFPEADVKISLDFLRDFGIIERIPLNDYSEVEVWQRKK